MDAESLINRLPGASEALRSLARRGVVRQAPKGRVLITEGEFGETLFIILSGQLRAFAAGDNGREITFATYGPGEHVGEICLDGGPRTASVEAVERTICAVVTRRTIEAHIAEHPEFAFELLGKIIGRARAATMSARQMALNDVYGRLRHLLESLAPEPADGPRRLRERLTHQEMARRIGCSREMVSRILKELERGGFIAVESRHIAIRQPLPVKW